MNGAQWGTDYANRAGSAKSNMFDNAPDETKYISPTSTPSGTSSTARTSTRSPSPRVQTPPVKGFWSLTLYNEHHFFEPNALSRYSLGTKNKRLQYNADGSLPLYAAAKSPRKDKESNWLPAPTGTFSLYLRAYWPDKTILDGTWLPPKIERVK